MSHAGLLEAFDVSDVLNEFDWGEGGHGPDFDMSTQKKSVVIRGVVGRIQPDDVYVDVSDSYVAISSHRPEYTFNREFVLPSSIDIDSNIDVTLHGSELVITLPLSA